MFPETGIFQVFQILFSPEIDFSIKKKVFRSNKTFRKFRCLYMWLRAFRRPHTSVFMFMSCSWFDVAISIFPSLSFPLLLSLRLSLSLSFSDVSFPSLSVSSDLSFFIRLYFFLKWPKIAATWHHNGTNNFSNRAQMGPRAAQMEPKWNPNGAKMESKRRKNKKKEPTQQNSGRRAKTSPHFERTWS